MSALFPLNTIILVAELCVLRTFGGVDFSLIFICAQSVPEFLWDRLRASIQFLVMPKRAQYMYQYARFSGEFSHRFGNSVANSIDESTLNQIASKREGQSQT
eukprot:COSAG02_NODE_2492_length_8691_cov_45.293412_13_plen_102_part_00